MECSRQFLSIKVPGGAAARASAFEGTNNGIDRGNDMPCNLVLNRKKILVDLAVVVLSPQVLAESTSINWPVTRIWSPICARYLREQSELRVPRRPA